MIHNQNNGSWESIDEEVIIIYEYFDEYAAQNEPEEVINEFRCLFIAAKCQSREVNRALNRIITSVVGQEKFALIFNYCLHIILDVWSSKPELLGYIEQLIAVVEGITSRRRSYDRTKAKLVGLITNYQQSQLYSHLKLLVIIITGDRPTQLDKSASLEEIIKRYTYLYPCFLTHNEHLPELSAITNTICLENQKTFELQLSQYIIYRTRLKQVASLRLLSKGAGKVIHQVANPTFLSERSMTIGIKQFVGLIDGEHTLLTLAQQFTARSQAHNSYGKFKQYLYQYLITGINPRNDNSRFFAKLKQKIADIFPGANSRPINHHLLVQTCRQLLSFLVTETADPPNLNNFAKLIVYLGSAQTALLLTKIILICPEAQSDLAQKLGILLAESRLRTIEELFWFVKCLEHLLVAHRIYCGKIDVSIAKYI